MTSFGYQTRLGFQLVTATRSGRKELYVRLFLSANYCRLTSKAHANSFLFNLVKTGAGFSRTTTCARGGPQKWKFGGRPDANGGSHDARPATPSSASQSQSTDDGSQVPRRPNKKKSDAPASRQAKAKRPEKLVVSGAFFRIQWPETGELPASRRFLISSTRCQQVSSRLLLLLVAAVVTGKKVK